uniref:Uncharacterized protein n=1 Tax=Rhizophora mucronata TaxID=61149 RepID=A0A2P2PH63_RHIMU
MCLSLSLILSFSLSFVVSIDPNLRRGCLHV